MKKLLISVVLAATSAAHAGLSEGEAAILGAAIGYAAASNQQSQQIYTPAPVYIQPQVQYQAPVYVQPRPVYVQPQPFVYGGPVYIQPGVHYGVGISTPGVYFQYRR